LITCLLYEVWVFKPLVYVESSVVQIYALLSSYWQLCIVLYTPTSDGTLVVLIAQFSPLSHDRRVYKLLECLHCLEIQSSRIYTLHMNKHTTVNTLA